MIETARIIKAKMSPPFMPQTTAMLVPCLRISIPKVATYDELIAELQYLETAACRASMSEHERVMKRKKATENFKALLS